MGDFVFNVSKGRVAQLVQRAKDGTGSAKIRVLLLKAADTDANNLDSDTIDHLLNTLSNTIADFTNFTRKDITSTVTRTVDDTADEQQIDNADIVWTNAGGATNNTLTDAIFYYDPDGTNTDTGNIPLTQHDFTPTTNGNDLTLQIPTNGFYAAT